MSNVRWQDILWKIAIISFSSAFGIALSKDILKIIKDIEGLNLIIYFIMFFVFLSILAVFASKIISNSKSNIAINSIVWIFIFILIGCGLWFIVGFVFGRINPNDLSNKSTFNNAFIDLLKYGVSVAFVGASGANLWESLRGKVQTGGDDPGST